MSIHDDWVLLEAPTDDAPLPVESPAIRSILLRRGIRTSDQYRLFASPTLADLHDPASIHGMDYACRRIEQAIQAGESILIYGDYDVDGVTSIVLLRTVLGALGGNVDFVVPHRLVDGYGLKMEVLERVLAERNVRLVITVDCGITSVAPVERALERGIDVIITDHHLPAEQLPKAAAVLNPHQEGCDYPFKDLAGVGVTFKLCCELLRRAGRKISIDSLLKITAIGTIADVAPLVGENRTIARLGLLGLADPRNPGLRMLIRSLGLFGSPLRSADVGFRIGPRINAAGRLASADTAIRLFAAASEADAFPLVMELNRLNQERQRLEAEVLEEARAQIESDGPAQRLLFLASEKWHQGVLGLCAGRIAQQYHRPAMMVNITGETCVGSGRSIAGVNLHAHLKQVERLFTHFGGHQHACGFSFRTADLDELRQLLRASFDALDDEPFRRVLRVDAVLTAGDLTPRFADEHASLEPFGSGNPQPLFLLGGMQVSNVRQFAENCFELALRDGTGEAAAVVWPSRKELMAGMAADGRIDVVAEVEPDRRARSGVRLVLVDSRPARPVIQERKEAGIC